MLQASYDDAQRVVDCAKTLADSGVSLLEALTSKRPFQPELSWIVIRPVLRLLLWLLPEHVPSSETLEALDKQAQQAQGHIRPKQGNTTGVPPADDWRITLTPAYMAAVATVGRRWLHAASTD
jgi:hypothetical protein